VIRPVLIALAAAALVGSAAPRRASASTVEIRNAQGHAVAFAGAGRFAYPASGAVVSVGRISLTPSTTVLRGVRLLDGEIVARRIALPTRGFAGARVDGLRVGGSPVSARPNTLASLGRFGYVVELQEAVATGQEGLVGLRVHVSARAGPLAAGSDLLVGIPSAPAAAARSPVAGGVLAFGAGPIAALPGGGSFVYPLTTRGPIVGCPFAIGSTHSPLAPPDNLESDDAVDIMVPIGTPVLAVAAGVIGSQIGSLDSLDPRMQGQRVHLDTAVGRFYYAHLSRIDVYPGEHVRAGQELGLSGDAAGVAHLHFAQDGGNPAVTIGQGSACPYFHQYLEPWD
jgi:hypothetical protein